MRKDDITVADNTFNEPNNVLQQAEINQLEVRRERRASSARHARARARRLCSKPLVDLERDVINMNESDQLLKKNYLEIEGCELDVGVVRLIAWVCVFQEWEGVLGKTDLFFQGVRDGGARASRSHALASCRASTTRRSRRSSRRPRRAAARPAARAKRST